MAKHKYIYWRSDLEPNDKDELFANIHLLIGYNQATLIYHHHLGSLFAKT